MINIGIRRVDHRSIPSATPPETIAIVSNMKKTIQIALTI